ncbi:hypothetical protein CMU02_08980 [Elizabethkingia anophelis]|uniref:hypothetical protein n=1 Tax=Elizabethkingia anophelis TaxID=1117645 RepID=UPI00293D0C9D|nr:hypothetical protein [Elizabethkingia anophelis]MDV3904944.1 hypothetical protein [Elizabethkingia anophelis]
MENKLIPISDFILHQAGWHESTVRISEYEFQQIVLRYTLFIKQPLTLGMFIPVDENNVPLEEPTQEKYGCISATSYEEESGWMYEGGEDKYQEAFSEWQKSKERVLFEGFHIIDFKEHQVETLKYTSFLQWDDIEIASKKEWEDNWDFEYPTIESLSLNNNLEITLTATAIKSIYGS